MGPFWDQAFSRYPRPKNPLRLLRHLGSFLGWFWALKLGYFGVISWTVFWILFRLRLEPFWDCFLLENQSKIKLFWGGSWRLSGAILGGFLAVLGLSWEAWCSTNAVNNFSKRMLSKLVAIAILALLDRFRGPSWLILARFGPQNGGQTALQIGLKIGSVFGYFLD